MRLRRTVLEPGERAIGQRAGKCAQQDVRHQVVCGLQVARVPQAALHERSERAVGAVLGQTRKRVAAVEKRDQIGFQHLGCRQVCGVQQGTHNAERDIFLGLRVRHKLHEFLFAIGRAKKRLEPFDSLDGRVNCAELVEQHRREIGLEMLGYQLDVRKPVALEPAWGEVFLRTRVYQEIAFGLITVYKPLQHELGPFVGFSESEQTVVRNLIAEPACSQLIELAFEGAIRIVPYYQSTFRGSIKRSVEAD